MKAIELNNLTKIYSKGIRKKTVSTAVKNVSFDVKCGSVFGLLGPNGAGKTSIVKMMCGLLTPSEGEISIYGKQMNQQASQVKQVTGALLEGNRSLYWPLSIKENLKYFGRIKMMKMVDIKRRSSELIKQMELEQYGDMPIAALSTGNRQKAALAATIIHEPKLLLLDEPTLGLDVHASKQLKEIIKAYVQQDDRTVFLTTHNMILAQEICDEFLILKQGEINRQFDRSAFEYLSDAFTYVIDVQPLKKISITFHELVEAEFPFKDQLIEMQVTENALKVTMDSFDLLSKIINWMKSMNYLITDIKKQEIKLEDIFLNMERGEQYYQTDVRNHMG